MSVEMKLGRWMARDGFIYEVDNHYGKGRWAWWSTKARTAWDNEGFWNQPPQETEHDLVRYLGPLELSPTPACADQAGTPVVSPVSTETAGEQLQRMRGRYNEMEREASIYSGLLAALDQAKSDLGERIRAMEREHDL